MARVVSRGLIAGAGAIATLLVWTALAVAGTFEVSACDAAGGANNSWTAQVTGAPWGTAYAECPSGGDPGKGMVSRNVVGGAGGAVPGAISARLLFTAPAGTSIVGLRASDDFYTASAHWEAALSADSYIVRGCGVGNPPPCRWSRSDEQIALNHAGQLGIDVYCPGSVCEVNSGSADHSYVVAAARLYSAVVRIEDNTAPAVGSISGGLWQDGWVSGTQGVTFDASDNTGIRHTEVLIDGQLVAQRAHACDGTRTVPCPQGTDSLTYNTSGVPDGPHRIAVQGTDSAGNPGAASRALLVDNTPPGAPQELKIEGGEAWHASNSFKLRWTTPKVDGAQIAGAAWQLCPASADQSGCVTGSKAGDKLASLDGLQVPRDGDWVLKLFLVDQAGNQTVNNAAPPVHLRVDRQPPTGVVFEPRDPANPAVVVIRASDEVSGLGSGSVDIKPQGSEKWTSVPASVDGGRLLATLPDERLADGPYDLRGHAVDQAGNETATTTLADGTPMTITLPVRAKTRLLGGHPRVVLRKGRRTKLFASSVRVRFGGRTSISGRLVDAAGRPMPGTTLQVSGQQHLPRAAFKPSRTVKTSKAGSFSFHTSRGGTARAVRVRYPGTATVRPAEINVQVNMAAKSTLKVSDRSVRRGQGVRFSGTLLGGHVPAAGKLVQLQAQVNGHWQVFANPRANNHGRWQQRYRFTGSYGNARLAFRIRIPRDPAYPFAVGTSPVARVSVRGP